MASANATREIPAGDGSVDLTGSRWLAALLPVLVVCACDRNLKPRTSPVAATQTASGLTLDMGGGTTMEFVRIPAGEFVMGWEGYGEEMGHTKPQHKVKLTKPFYMSIYEVTQGQYASAMGTNPALHQDPQYPVDRVSWDDATKFCRRVSSLAGVIARLPTEAEWEYACRAGSTTRFCFGDDERQLRNYAWYSESREPRNRVGQKKPNAWGLYDMHGNVAEWCFDWYGPYSSQPQIDPTGPGTGRERVVRGGNLYSSEKFCCSACRDCDLGRRPRDLIGFRVVIECP